MWHTSKNKIFIAFITLIVVCGVLPVRAESLFKTGVRQNVSPMTPRSWFANIRATNVGDLVTILVEDTTAMENTVDLNSNKKSSVTDEWSGILDDILPGKGVVPNVDGWGGDSKVTNSATIKRTNSISQTITTQVVQVLPNGNLVLQGRKRIVNSGERQDVIISGIVNPRLIDGEGQIPSKYVGNLQVAIVGKGTVSRAQRDGVMNRLWNLLF
jgi:flagellar L-ring protein precursor FlgH